MFHMFQNATQVGKINTLLIISKGKGWYYPALERNRNKFRENIKNDAFL